MLRTACTVVNILLAATLLTPMLWGQAQPIQTEDTMAAGDDTTITLPWHIYRHFPADFSRWHEAAVGFRGWDSEVRPLDLSRTCLALMHFPDRGLTPDSEFGPDALNPDYLGTIEWIPRTMDVVTFRMPRLLEAARAAGLQVAHVGTTCRSEKERAIWDKCVAEASDPPPADPDVISPGAGWQAQHSRDVFDLPRQNPPDVPQHQMGLPDYMLAQGDDIREARRGDGHLHDGRPLVGHRRERLSPVPRTRSAAPRAAGRVARLPAASIRSMRLMSGAILRRSVQLLPRRDRPSPARRALVV